MTYQRELLPICCLPNYAPIALLPFYCRPTQALLERQFSGPHTISDLANPSRNRQEILLANAVHVELAD